MRAIILAVVISIFSIDQISSLPINGTYYQTHSKEEKVSKMTALLGLTADQQKKYKDLLTSSEKEVADLKVKLKTASKEDKKKLQDAYKTNYEAQLKKILTAEQFKKLQEEAKKKKK